MRAGIRLAVLFAGMAFGVQAVIAAEQKAAQPAMDPAQQAAMEAMMKAGGPSEAHKALEPLAGTWDYTGSFWMAPGQEPETMTGKTVSTLIFGGRFLKQEVTGSMKDQQGFEGLGFVGYDNIRKEYVSLWFDNMATGIMVGSGQFDAAAKTFNESATVSCPMTQETHRKVRSAWTLVDANHSTYESYMPGPDGKEYKAMEIKYTRVP